MTALVERLKGLLFRRQHAYRRTFDPAAQSSREVLEDLAWFCKANETTFHKDPRVQAVLEGRREVWLRIVNHLALDQEALWELYQRGRLRNE